MSIVRMGMAEDEKFGAGYDAIFGKPGKGERKTAARSSKPEKAAKKSPPKKSKTKKK